MEVRLNRENGSECVELEYVEEFGLFEERCGVGMGVWVFADEADYPFVEAVQRLQVTRIGLGRAVDGDSVDQVRIHQREVQLSERFQWQVAADVGEGIHRWLELLDQFTHVIVILQLVVDVDAKKLDGLEVLDLGFLMQSWMVLLVLEKNVKLVFFTFGTTLKRTSPTSILSQM